MISLVVINCISVIYQTYCHTLQQSNHLFNMSQSCSLLPSRNSHVHILLYMYMIRVILCNEIIKLENTKVWFLLMFIVHITIRYNMLESEFTVDPFRAGFRSCEAQLRIFLVGIQSS